MPGPMVEAAFTDVIVHQMVICALHSYPKPRNTSFDVPVKLMIPRGWS
jgi:hypothetical protein